MLNCAVVSCGVLCRPFQLLLYCPIFFLLSSNFFPFFPFHHTVLNNIISSSLLPPSYPAPHPSSLLPPTIYTHTLPPSYPVTLPFSSTAVSCFQNKEVRGDPFCFTGPWSECSADCQQSRSEAISHPDDGTYSYVVTQYLHLNEHVHCLL